MKKDLRFEQTPAIIYWCNCNNNTIYTLFRTKVDVWIKYFDSKNNAFDRITIYQLETVLTPSLIEKLLNGDFKHCMLPNYNDAKLIYETKKKEG